MNGSMRTVSDKLDVKGKTINQIMSWYYDDELIVNRKYQRKLVWGLDEKKLFIDSILNKFPTPSIILASYDIKDIDGNTEHHYEIIDGLQRLNAIVSFVNGDFSVPWYGNECYFDVQFIPKANMKKLEGKLIQKTPVLPFEISQMFSDFEMPIVLTSQSDKKIEQIFSRINSSGRKLSAHDLRQASSVGELPDLVRRIATNLRGDYTYSDEINLCDMPKISISSYGLNYGIKPETVFWRRHDIIPFNNLRQSKDEEIIASILATILMGKDFRINAETLSNLYDPQLECCKNITKKINEIGKDRLENIAIDIINQIDNIFNSVNSDFTSYLYTSKKAGGKDDSFKILFCALYNLYLENYFIDNYQDVAKKLRSCSDSIFGLLNKKDVQYPKKMEAMDLLYQALRSVMVKKHIRDENELEVLVKKLLSFSKIEQQMVEFKIGITFFDSGKVNSEVISKIAKTLVAMSNTKCDIADSGYVIIGIADNSQSCNDWESYYHEKPIVFGSHQIVGITREALTHFNGIDGYGRAIVNLLKKEPINDELKQYILSNHHIFEFYGKDLLIFKSRKMHSQSTYDGKSYIRNGCNTICL